MMMKLAASVFTIAVVLLAPEADAAVCDNSECLLLGGYGECHKLVGGTALYQCMCGITPHAVTDEACPATDACMNNPCVNNGATGFCGEYETEDYYCHCGDAWLTKSNEACPLVDVCKDNQCDSEGDHASCRADPTDATKAQCLCSDYTTTATDKCALVAECKDNTCGEHGTCAAAGGTYQCFCADGEVLVAGEVCPNPPGGSAFGLGCKAAIVGAAAFALL